MERLDLEPKLEMEVASNKIPNPKEKYGISFWISHMMCEALLNLNELELATKWVQTHKLSLFSELTVAKECLWKVDLLTISKILKEQKNYLM